MEPIETRSLQKATKTNSIENGLFSFSPNKVVVTMLSNEPLIPATR